VSTASLVNFFFLVAVVSFSPASFARRAHPCDRESLRRSHRGTSRGTSNLVDQPGSVKNLFGVAHSIVCAGTERVHREDRDEGRSR
jgi:hypothetical protein